jgi:uncharacterized protein (TIGR00251 family)
MRGDAPAALLTVEVRPRAGRDEVAAASDGTLRVRVAAPPAEGAANEAVRAVLAGALGCPRSAVTIVRGARGRTKVVRVAGLSLEAARARLGATPAAAAEPRERWARPR